MASFSLELIWLPFGKCDLPKVASNGNPSSTNNNQSEDPLALEAPLFFIAGGASTVPRSERDHTTLAEYINR